MDQIQIEYLNLLRTVIREEPIDEEILKGVDWSKIFEIAVPHSQAELFYYYCQKTNINLPAKVAAIGKLQYEHGLHRELLMDYEREELYRFFRKEKIWHCSLKGIHLKEFYPSVGLRYSSDNDILVDKSRVKEIRSFMVKRGYKVIHFAARYKDATYIKKPSYNFEIHQALYESWDNSKAAQYFNRISERLVDCGDYLYEMSPEDEYMYLIAHMYRHYTESGIGIRSLLDIYLYLREYEDRMDFGYVKEKMEDFSLDEYETQIRTLAMKIFNGDVVRLEDFDEEERKTLRWMFLSGSHGTDEIEVYYGQKKAVEEYRWIKNKRLAFILYKIFPREDIKHHWPMIYRTKILIPGLLLYRIIRGMFNGRAEAMLKKRNFKKLS